MGSPQPDTVPSGPWVLYLKTDVPVSGAVAKYGIRLFDGKLYSARAEQTIGKSTLPAPKIFAHADMDNTAVSGVYTEKGATDASGNEDLNATNSAAHSGSDTDPIPVYSAYGNAVKLTVKKDDGNPYPAGVILSQGVQLVSGSGLNDSIDVKLDFIKLPSPADAGGESVYKVTVKATGEGFDDSTTRTLYYKVCREVKAVNNLPMWHILKEAIAHTSAGGTVVVNGEIKATNASGNYDEITITKNLTIKKAVGASSAVINANRTDSGKTGHLVFRVNFGELTLKNLTLKGGRPASGVPGGGIFVNTGAGASLTDCRITDCVSMLGNGGAVYTQGTLSLTRGSIGGTGPQEGNKARYGGGIYVAGGRCMLTGTEVAKNYADGGTSSSSEGKGGGIYVAQGGICSLYDVDDMKGNMVKNGSPNKGAGTGIYVESGGTCNIAGGTKIDEANDVYLAKYASDSSKNAKITVTASLTGTHTVAKITPEDYTADVTAVNAAPGVDISAYAKRFKITDQNPTTPWKLIYNGTALVLKQATTVIPGGSNAWKTLKEAIEAPAVEDDDEFLVQGSITATNATGDYGAISVTKKITVKGAGSTLTLDANTRSRIFTVENGGELTLENLTLKNGKAASSGEGAQGGGILVKAGCKAHLKNCIIKNCEATGAGGGIYSVGELVLDGSTIGGASAFDGNKSKNGGGICLEGSAGMTLQNCIIKNNEVTDGEGGGICFDSGSYGSSEYTITGGEISYNKIKTTDSILTRSGGGLAIANMQIKVVIDSCTIEGNTIEGVSGKNPRGAGLWLGNDAQTTIKGASRIKDNKLHETGNPNSFIGTGGGIQIDGGTLTVQGSTVISGNGAKDGGGVYIDGGTFTMTGGEIKSNTAKNGGGVYINAQAARAGSFTMKGGEIKDNTAQNGGGVYVNSQDSEMGTFKMSGSATVTPSTGNEAGKNDVYLADFSDGNGGYYDAKITVTGALANTSVARLTMRHDEEPLKSGYIAGRQVVEGIKSDDDALKFKVTPQRVPPPDNIQNWRVEYIITGSGEHIGKLKKQ